MQLFYVSEITLPLCVLPEDESRHCARVLRLGAGDTVHLTDGRGMLCEGRIAEADQRRCVVEIIGSRSDRGRRSYNLTMAVAPTKSSDRFEWFLEKATEIGVDRIVPLDCRHSERRTVNAERCGRILTGAMKQSLGVTLPRLEPVTRFDLLVAAPFDGVKLIAHCYGSASREYMGELVSHGDDALIMIGPEGDFSEAEAALAIAHGFRAVSLGESRLRTETAAIVAVAEMAMINKRRDSR
jgi:16S rRNA (uracil1498-N3)-methyltransferase